MLIHLHLASQQHFVIALRTLSAIEIHMVPYKYTFKAFLQFPILAGESPKWNILVVTWALVSDLSKIYTHIQAASSCSCVYFRQITSAHVTATT